MATTHGHGVDHALAADHARVKERDPRQRHQQHECGGSEHPGRVGAVDALVGHEGRSSDWRGRDAVAATGTAAGPGKASAADAVTGPPGVASTGAGCVSTTSGAGACADATPPHNTSPRKQASAPAWYRMVCVLMKCSMPITLHNSCQRQGHQDRDCGLRAWCRHELSMGIEDPAHSGRCRPRAPARAPGAPDRCQSAHSPATSQLQ